MENICRTCMVNSEDMEMELDLNETKLTSIFVSEIEISENPSPKELIQSSVPQLKVEENDMLPQKICRKCLETIRDIYNFQQKCLDVEQKLYKMLDEDSGSLRNIEFLEENPIKTETINYNTSPENSMDYISDRDKLLDEDVYNKSIDSICVDTEESDWVESKSKESIKRTRKRKVNGSGKTKEKKEKDLKQSTRKRRKKSEEDGTKELFPCSKCQRKLLSHSSLLKHQEFHQKKDKEELELKCNICQEEFANRILLINHKRTHTNEKQFLCPECGKGFYSAGNLTQHLHRHSGVKPYACSECPKSFTTKNDLTYHYDVHKPKPRIHVCDVCGKGFHKAFLLKLHQRYHNNERTFPCEFCEKSFVTSEKQKRHMRTHTGEKPYPCKYCDRAFAQSNDRIKHLRQHLGENVYQCELCPLRFPLARDLRVHFASHKDDDDATRARNLAARVEEERNMQIKLIT